VRVGDQALPADRRARFLEVDAHDEAEVLAQLGRAGGEEAGVLAGGLRVVHAAGADDDEQPVVGPLQDRGDVGAAVQDYFGLVVGERKLLEQLRRGRERHRALDAQVAYLLEMARRVHGGLQSLSGRSPIPTMAPGS
jgi:hypothetical protein